MGKLRGLSLFSNVGVAEAYLKNIGVDILLANELLEDRARFYAEVYPETKMVCGDICDDSLRKSIIDEAVEKNIDFIIATPPCQGMSNWVLWHLMMFVISLYTMRLMLLKLSSQSLY